MQNPATPLPTRELILNGLAAADQVEYWSPDFAGPADFFSADAAAGGDDEFVIIVGDHTHITPKDLDDAEIKPDGTGFSLHGESFTLFAKTQINLNQPGSATEWTPESHWDDHPDYPVEDWKYEVKNGDTRQGYINWVNHQMEVRAGETDGETPEGEE